MSTDGVHWSISHSPSTSDGWGSVAFGNGTFVAFDGNGTGLMATSVNGTVWAYHSYPHAGSNWSGTFGCNQFFSVSSYNVVGNANYEFSSLGATWSATPTALDVSGVNWAAVGYGNGKFVAVNDAGHITWKAASGPCKQNVPDPVTNVRGTVAANKLTVNWNAPTYGGVKKTSSYVVKVTSDGFLKRCYSTSTTCSISGLKAKATYAVVVTAVNEAGYFSVPSDAVSVLAPATSNFAITPTSPVRLVGQDVTAWISGAPTYTTVTAKIGATTTGCFTNGFGQCELSFVESLAGQHLIGATYVAAHVTHHATNAEFSSLSVTGIASSYATSASISATFTGGVPNAYGALSIEGVTTSSKLDASGNGVVNATAPASVGTGSTMINVYDDGQLLESVAINLTM